jgi:hypothetical protein
MMSCRTGMVQRYPKNKCINKAGDDLARCIRDVTIPVMNGITSVKEFMRIGRLIQ